MKNPGKNFDCMECGLAYLKDLDVWVPKAAWLAVGGMIDSSTGICDNEMCNLDSTLGSALSNADTEKAFLTIWDEYLVEDYAKYGLERELIKGKSDNLADKIERSRDDFLRVIDPIRNPPKKQGLFQRWFPFLYRNK